MLSFVWQYILAQSTESHHGTFRKTPTLQDCCSKTWNSNDSIIVGVNTVMHWFRVCLETSPDLPNGLSSLLFTFPNEPWMPSKVISRVGKPRARVYKGEFFLGSSTLCLSAFALSFLIFWVYKSHRRSLGCTFCFVYINRNSIAKVCTVFLECSMS